MHACRVGVGGGADLISSCFNLKMRTVLALLRVVAFYRDCSVNDVIDNVRHIRVDVGGRV